MIYKISFVERAKKDIAYLRANEPNCFKKAVKLLNELAEHPRTGTGQPEQFKGDRAGQWSRRISRKHRLVYLIRDKEVVVLILSAYGHYDDR